MKVIKRGFTDYSIYEVNTKAGTAHIDVKECNVSCGVLEVEGVGYFISNLKAFGLSSKEIAGEVKAMTNRVKKRGKQEASEGEDGSAFVMVSLAAPNKLHRTVCSHLKRDGAVVTRWRNNPNSGNKINVVIM